MQSRIVVGDNLSPMNLHPQPRTAQGLCGSDCIQDAFCMTTIRHARACCSLQTTRVTESNMARSPYFNIPFFHPYPNRTPGVLQIIPIPTGRFPPQLPGSGTLWSAMPIPPRRKLYGRGPKDFDINGVPVTGPLFVERRVYHSPLRSSRTVLGSRKIR